MSTLADVSILVTSFLRFGYLRDCLASIQANLPECPVVIVDDSEELHDGSTAPKPFITKSTEVAPSSTWWMVRLPFDSGLSAKRNAGVRAVTTPYTLLAADDFDFSPRGARLGIERLLKVLDEINALDVVGGRVNGNAYEGFLDYVPGEYIKETRLQTDGMRDGDVALCDLTVNYFLARTEVLRKIPWDEDIKPIGGEHGQYFLHLKEAGYKVAFVKGVNVNTLPHDPSKIDPRYPAFRARAVTHGHKIFMQKRNIKQYIGF